MVITLALLLLILQGDRAPASRPASKPAAGEVVYSGPQKGEKTPAFRVVDVTGDRKEREFDPAREAGEGNALYFFFAVPADTNRLLARALVNVTTMAAQAREHGLKPYVIGLAPDRLQGDQKLRDMWGAMKLQVPALLSVDGAEGPGNWGINRKCLVTVVLAREGKVVSSYAAVAPADSDYDLLREELSKLVGKPITARGPGGREMQGEASRPRPPKSPH